MTAWCTKSHPRVFLVCLCNAIGLFIVRVRVVLEYRVLSAAYVLKIAGYRGATMSWRDIRRLVGLVTIFSFVGCHYLWLYDTTPENVSQEVVVVSAQQASDPQVAMHQTTGRIEFVVAEQRRWFSRISQHNAADIPPAWGWLGMLVFVFLWLCRDRLAIWCLGELLGLH